MVQNNKALLTEIWKGSPSTTSLLFGIDGEMALQSGTNSNLKDEGSVGKCISGKNIVMICAKYAKGAMI